jgi:hypothetical protein
VALQSQELYLAKKHKFCFTETSKKITALKCRYATGCTRAIDKGGNFTRGKEWEVKVIRYRSLKNKNKNLIDKPLKIIQ